MALLGCQCGHSSCLALPSHLQCLDASAGCTAGSGITASEGHTDGAQHRHKQLCLKEGCLMRALRALRSRGSAVSMQMSFSVH